MIEAAPDRSPFALPGFARFWDSWRGRESVSLAVRDVSGWYVRRAFGPLCTRAALPFGLPVFRDDHDASRADWLRTFFALGRTIRATATLYMAPRHVYPGVQWTARERLVVERRDDWRRQVESPVLRRSRRAREAGWQVRPLAAEEVARAGAAVSDTDRRHGVPRRFPATFYARLLETVADPERLYVLGAVRGDTVGAFQVVFRQGDYEVGWALCSTDLARAESVGPLLTYAWLEQSFTAGGRAVDLGASPNAGVRRFKASFGARPALLHTGTRRWHLRGD